MLTPQLLYAKILILLCGLTLDADVWLSIALPDLFSLPCFAMEANFTISTDQLAPQRTQSGLRDLSLHSGLHFIRSRGYVSHIPTK